ncbi:MAG: FtsH protease activity modulator HflK, partial [Candidatus Omnitrophica bacterium]|nr:FtsH protease activity modulator HflK [Candidatus Omnitrophota bacterium]
MDDFKSPEDLFGGSEELARKAKEGWQKLSRNIPFAVLVVAVIAAGLSSFYSVGPDEVGVVRRFGAYARSTNPG